MFKEKSSKKRLTVIEGSKETSTLDARHQNMVQQLQRGLSEKDIMQQQKKIFENEIFLWKSKIRSLHGQENTHIPEYEVAWTSNLYFSNCLRELQVKMKDTLDEKKEIEYYENTANILFEYYNLIENQESIVIGNGVANMDNTPYIPSVKHSKGRKKFVPPNQKSILEAFQMIQKEKEIEETSEEDLENTEDNLDYSLTVSKKYKDKASLVDEYMLLVDSNYMKNVNNTAIGNCQKCDISLTCLLQEGIMICASCGYQELLLVEQNRPIYRQSNKEASHQSYKRINHFNEWISQIQGKESTDIPEEIFEKIVQEIKKEKIKDTAKLSYHKMREILKKLKFNKYYEHIYYIIYRLNGIAPPNFSPDLEEKLRNMFKEIQGPFLKHCPDKRKNFLSYSYVLFKFCQLLEKDEYLKHFSLLKSREKLHVQDQIWKKICEEVHWEFIQSI